MSGSSKGVTGKELMSFFLHFKALQLRISHMLMWRHKYLFDGAGNGQSSRTQADSKIPWN